jgi:hypothetical protein
MHASVMKNFDGRWMFCLNIGADRKASLPYCSPLFPEMGSINLRILVKSRKKEKRNLPVFCQIRLVNGKIGKKLTPLTRMRRSSHVRCIYIIAPFWPEERGKMKKNLMPKGRNGYGIPCFIPWIPRAVA